MMEGSMRKDRLLLVELLLVVVMLAVPTVGSAAGNTCGPCTYSWTAPTTDTDGNPITEPLTYNVWAATTAGGPYTLVGTTTATSLVVKGLGNGQKFGAVSARSATEGPKSPDIPFTYTVSPAAPANVGIQ
jgi:hypothetical protein